MSDGVVLYTDGASLGNPGPAGIGYILYDGEAIVAERSEDIGYGTNNQAEYRAVIAGLTEARDRGIARLVVRSDSELLVRQLTGAYKVRNQALRPLKAEVDSLVAHLDRVRFEHVRRERNARADELAKAGAEAARARGVGPAQPELLE